MTRLDIRALEDLLGPRPAIAYEYDSFDAFCDQVERLMSVDIDGDEERDGYSLESVYDAWSHKFTAEEYAAGRRVSEDI